MKHHLFILVLLAAIAIRPLPSHACAALTPDEKSHVSIVEEAALIVWDQQRQTQHFIRQATFDSTGQSVGFIVPTPSVPELVEADPQIFNQLNQIIQPEVVYKDYTAYRLSSLFMGSGGEAEESAAGAPGGAPGRARPPVEVLSTQKVGDYDATVLRATDAGALNKWLQKNKYQSNLAFEKWLEVYVRQGWIITAFKIGKGEARTPRFSSSLVRMSFKTPRPFYPYREPQQAEKAGGKRSLRVFFLAPSRFEAAPAKFGTQSGWPAKTTWAGDVTEELNNGGLWDWFGVVLKLPLNNLKHAHWLTVFEDNTSPRPGTDDVFFKLTANTVVVPPPVTEWRPNYRYVSIELIAFVAFIALMSLGFLLKRLRMARFVNPV